MIHIFNRKELITVSSDKLIYSLQSALESAGIPYRTKSNMPLASADRYHGTPGIRSDASHPIVIYVKKSDFGRAKEAIQPVLRGQTSF